MNRATVVTSAAVSSSTAGPAASAASADAVAAAHRELEMDEEFEDDDEVMSEDDGLEDHDATDGTSQEITSQLASAGTKLPQILSFVITNHYYLRPNGYGCGRGDLKHEEAAAELRLRDKSLNPQTPADKDSAQAQAEHRGVFPARRAASHGAHRHPGEEPEQLPRFRRETSGGRGAQHARCHPGGAGDGVVAAGTTARDQRSQPA